MPNINMDGRSTKIRSLVTRTAVQKSILTARAGQNHMVLEAAEAMGPVAAEVMGLGVGGATALAVHTRTAQVAATTQQTAGGLLSDQLGEGRVRLGAKPAFSFLSSGLKRKMRLQGHTWGIIGAGRGIRRAWPPQ